MLHFSLILIWATLQSDINFAYLSALIGLDESFVRWRVHTLMESNMLALHGVDYIATENGERKYLAKDPIQKDRVIYGNLVVDGNTLDLLDVSFYQNKAWLLDRKSDILPHRPIMSVNDAGLQKTLKALDRLPILMPRLLMMCMWFFHQTTKQKSATGIYSTKTKC